MTADRYNRKLMWRHWRGRHSRPKRVNGRLVSMRKRVREQRRRESVCRRWFTRGLITPIIRPVFTRDLIGELVTAEKIAAHA